MHYTSSGVLIADYGNAPEFYCDLIARAVDLGSGTAELIFCRNRALISEAELRLQHALSVIMPISTIGAGMEQLATLPGLVWPKPHRLARRLLTS